VSISNLCLSSDHAERGHAGNSSINKYHVIKFYCKALLQSKQDGEICDEKTIYIVVASTLCELRFSGAAEMLLPISGTRLVWRSSILSDHLREFCHTMLGKCFQTYMSNCLAFHFPTLRYVLYNVSGLLDQFWPPIVPYYSTEDAVRIGNSFITIPITRNYNHSQLFLSLFRVYTIIIITRL
jgi:hypothetical protein